MLSLLEEQENQLQCAALQRLNEACGKLNSGSDKKVEDVTTCLMFLFVFF